MTTRQHDHAVLFRRLHDSGVLTLANVWDVASACVAADAGASAVATTSAGVAWSLGWADGDQLVVDRAVDLVARVAAAVDVPVTADIESGFATTADGVADTVGSVIDAGAVGINIEDAVHGGPGGLRSVEEQADRVAAARQAADSKQLPLFVNARVDTYLRAVGDPAGRLDATLARAAAYLTAGADGIFVPGVIDLTTVTELAAAIDAPLNILAGPGAPPVAEFARLGVARVSLGSAVASAAYGLVGRAVRELASQGTYTAIGDGIGYGELDGLMSHSTDADFSRRNGAGA